MVSEAWMKENKMYSEIAAVAAPPDLTLFSLHLDTNGLHKAEINYLADDES
jgi:hypothetical protein